MDARMRNTLEDPAQGFPHSPRRHDVSLAEGADKFCRVHRPPARGMPGQERVEQLQVTKGREQTRVVAEHRHRVTARAESGERYILCATALLDARGALCVMRLSRLHVPSGSRTPSAAWSA